MTEQDTSSNISGAQNRLNPSHVPHTESSSEIMGTYRRAECPPTTASVTYPVHAAPCASYYGHPPMGYSSDYPDRYSMGYQRMGQTITLTSHKIQFGCQGNSRSGRPNQRCAGPAHRHQYHMLPSVGKPWMEACADRSQNTSKSNNRGRTTYSDDQIAELESVFNTNPYPTSQTRQRLAYRIEVPEGKVKIWFQNRRARAKKSKLSCAVPWRTAINESAGLDERANHNNNNNNVKELSTKMISSDSNIPIASILPLPTKNSIASSGLASCMPAWRGYYDTSLRNPACGRTFNQNACSMHGSCSCNELSTRYPMRIGLDRYVPGPSFSMTGSNFMRQDNKPYTANGLASPPPIRRLIYPFHTLTENSMKVEQEAAPEQSYPTSTGLCSFGVDNDLSSLQPYSCGRSTQPTTSTGSTYSELRQYAGDNWVAGQRTSFNPLAYNSANKLDSIYSLDAAQNPGSHVVNRPAEISVHAAEGYHSAELMMNCLKHEDSVDDSKASLTYAASNQAEQVWDNRDSSNILVKAMECTENDGNSEKPPSNKQSVSQGNSDSAVRTSDLPIIWPAHFSGSMCPPAPPSIVG